MTTYKGIKGLSIQTVAGDPSNLSDGLIWYDSAARKIQGAKLAAGVWASGGTLNTNQRAMSAGYGLQTAAICVGGITSPGGVTDVVEKYDGSSWTEVGDINTARGTFAGAGGTQSSSVVAGGSPNLAICESWDNSSWTEVGDLNTGRQAGASCGTSNSAALIASGNPNLAIAELWNGTAWTEVADLSTARSHAAGAGTTTAMLVITGYNPNTVNVESWNGTGIANVNTARRNLGGGGTSTSAVIFGGNSPPIVGSTEQWDGSSWAETTDLNTAGNDFGTGDSGDSGSLAIAISGSPPSGGGTRGTEEWTHVTTAVTFTSS